MFHPYVKALRASFLCAALLIAITSVSMAGTLELLSHNSEGYINNAYFAQIDPDNSTGTGVIQPFLHIQKNGIEQGYNTDSVSTEFIESISPWTTSLLLADVPVIKVGDVYYREFMLDINESGGGNELLSLNKLQIFLGTTGDLTGYPLGLGTMVWDMDGGAQGDMSIHLDASLESGSGDGDMLAYIPNSLFTGQGSYVYLYSMFGSETKNDPLGSSDGFEEWSVRQATPPVPEPGSLLALSTGLVSLLGLSRRRFAKR